MNDNQLRVYELIKDACNEYFGGNENALLDNAEDSKHYQDAKKAPTAPANEICETIEAWVRSTRAWHNIDNLHFVSLEWVRERIAKRVAKEIEITRRNCPEIF